MPRYKKEINRLIEPLDVQKMLERCKNEEQKVLIILLYLTGARPIEIISLRKKDFLFLGNELHIRLATAKGGIERTLPFALETPFLDILLSYLNGISDPERSVFSFRTTTRIKQIVNEVSLGELCPYNFRHSRLSKLAMMGATFHELMYWKGAKDTRSVSDYLYRNPAVLSRWKDKIF